MSRRIWFLVGLLITTMFAVSACDAVASPQPTIEAPEVFATSIPVPTLTPEVEKEPSIDVQPQNALADEVVKIQVLDLEPGQTITLTASMRDDRDRQWESYAVFRADSEGQVDVAAQAPITGTYSSVDPMGLIWSMLPNVPGTEYPYFANWETYYVLVTIKAEANGELIATGYMERIRLPQNVEKTAVSEEGLVGTLFVPDGAGPYPTLLVLGGSDGGIDTTKAAMLAAHGYAALALDYFGQPPLPNELSEIPLEYFKTAIDWLKSQEVVDNEKIGVVGASRGGELALLLGATYPELKVVVGYMASGVVYAGYTSTGKPLRAAWTYEGEPIPFSPETDIDDATIPVERINGPILLISGADDQIWPSTELSEIAIARLQQYDHPYPFEHLVYENGGHLIGVPYWPTVGDSFIHPVSHVQYTVGGTTEGNAHASAGSWANVLAFLENNFKDDMPQIDQ